MMFPSAVLGDGRQGFLNFCGRVQICALSAWEAYVYERVNVYVSSWMGIVCIAGHTPKDILVLWCMNSLALNRFPSVRDLADDLIALPSMRSPGSRKSKGLNGFAIGTSRLERWFRSPVIAQVLR